MFLLNPNVIPELRKLSTGKVDPNFKDWAEGAQAATGAPLFNPRGTTP
jgi:hypothetical protein